MTPNIKNLLSVWERRPRRVLEFANEDDWNYILEFLVSTKNAIPEITLLANRAHTHAALPPAVNGNPENGESLVEENKNAPTGIVARNEPWKPRWVREDVTNPSPAPVTPVVATPSSGVQSSPALESSTRIQDENLHTDDTDALNDHKSRTSGIPSSAGARLDAARKVAATSKAPSSRRPKSNRAKVKSSTLP